MTQKTGTLLATKMATQLRLILHVVFDLLSCMENMIMLIMHVDTAKEPMQVRLMYRVKVVSS